MDEKVKPKSSAPTSSGPLKKTIQGLSSFLDPLTKSGSYIGAFFLACMMFLTFIDVLDGRLGKWSVINTHTKLFGPIVGGQELIELFTLVLVSFALGYCASRQGHIRVDLLMQYTSKKTNQWFDLFANAISAVFYIFITWQAFKYGLDNIRDKTVTTILTIPVPPFNFIIFIGGVIVTLVFIRDFLKSIEEVKS
jgi:TRAP-type C4-dicarboxylate transport system permease small subunit